MLSLFRKGLQSLQAFRMAGDLWLRNGASECIEELRNRS
jgi:hypothetical protein